MSSFYKYNVVAKTGDLGLQDLSNLPSINDLGQVAVIGDFNTGSFGSEGIIVGDGAGAARNIAPIVNNPNQNLGSRVQINNQGQVASTFLRLNGLSLTSAIRYYDSNNTDNFETVATGVGTTFPSVDLINFEDENFHSIFPIVSLNNSNESVFVVRDKKVETTVEGVFDPITGTTIPVLKVFWDAGEITLVTANDKPIKTKELLTTLARPMIADNGNVVTKFGSEADSPIVLFNKNLNVINTIASSNSGFSEIGLSPGISDDGSSVAFYGANSDGKGIFARINGSVKRITGISGNGILDPGETHDDKNNNGTVEAGEDIGFFQDFNANTRVGITSNGGTSGTIAYIAFDESGNKGIYTNDFNVVNSNVEIAAPKLVIENGDTVSDLTGTVSDVNIYDPINSSGDIAFWLSTTTSEEAVVRAQPQDIGVDLAITKTDSIDPVSIEQEFTYTLNITNKSDSEATEVEVTDTLPEGLEFVSTNINPNDFTINDNNLTFDLGTLAANDSTEIKIKVKPTIDSQPVENPPPEQWTITNTAQVTSKETDSDPSNNNTEELTEVTSVFLVNTTGDKADPTPGDGNPDVEPNQDGLQVTLRSLIQYANDNPGIDEIEFDIPTNTIQINSKLPDIKDSIIIDGNNQIELRGNKGAFAGLTITAGDSTVKGLTINNFGGAGILLKDKGNNTIEDNQIGTNLDGTQAVGNLGDGILVQSSDNTIEDNLISGNGKIADKTGSGVSITGDITGNLIEDNFIGTNFDGTKAVGNIVNGVFISDKGGNTIKDNVISGNLDDGIDIRNADDNIIQGNNIGTDVTGNNNLGNRERGIHVEGGNNNRIGGQNEPEEGNIIAFNEGINKEGGVVITSGTGNAILDNLIFDNKGLGIDLGNDGFTSNDLGDTDTGANNLQNSPVINSITTEETTTTITASLDSTPNTTFKVEFFHNEGKEFLGSQSVTTDDTGNITFNFTSDRTDVKSVIATATDPNGNTSEFTQSINLFPLKVEGNFLDTDNDGVFEANGEILIGRADGIFPLIRLEGKAEYDDKTFKAEGKVFWEDESLGVENNEIIKQPLFEGNFNIDIGQSFTKEGQFIETQVLSQDAKIGGLDIEFSSLNLLRFGIALDGDFKLPEKLLEIDIPNFGTIDIPDSIDPLSGLEIQAKNNDALFIGQTINGQKGIGFGSESGKIRIPFGNTNLFDLIGIKSGEADLDYIPEEDKLEIKGKFTLRAPLLELDIGLIEAEIPEFTLDLEGEGLDEKSIQIKDGIVDIDAVIKTSKDAELELPLGFEFSDFEVALKSNNGKLTDIVGKTNIEFPWSKIKILPDSAVTEIGFKTNKSTAIDEKDAPFVLDDVVVEAGGFNIPIKPPVLFWNDIKGGIKNITPTNDENIEYVGGIGLSVGPEIKFKPPTLFGFDVFDFIGLDIPDDEIALAKIKLEAERGFQEVKQTNTENSEELVALGGKVALSLIHEDLFKSEGELKWDWAKKTFESAASVSTISPTILLSGVFKGSSKLTINYADETKLVSTIKGEFQVPDLGIFWGARGRTYLDSNASIVFSDNDEPRDDFIAVWTTFTLPIPNPIPDEDSYTIGFHISFDGDFDIISSSKEIPLIGSWDIEAGTPWFLVTATWENSTSDDVQIRVETPDGSFIEESDFAANGIYIVEELSGAYSKTVVVDNPTPGIWDYEVVDDTGLGEVTYTASRDTIAPTTEIVSTVVDETNSEITINYNAFDGDSEAQISLFYDTDNQDFDGVPIVLGLAENDGAGSFVWTPEGVAPGEYFVYAMSQDENNAPVFSYSTEKVQVSGEADLSVSKVANVESVDIGEELTYTVTVTNNGAIDSKGITLLESLPRGATFISGSVTLVEQADDLLTFDLGDLASGASKNVDITIKAPTIIGSTDIGSLVTSKTFDPIPSNDAEILITEVTNNKSLSELSVDDVSLAEGNEDNKNFTFRVSLAEVSTETITIDYATEGVTANAEQDYLPVSGTLEFAPGETEKTINVEVIDDAEFEPDEIFTVNLSNATNAAISTAFGTGTILNDDISSITLVDDTATTDENTPIEIDIFANDSNIDRDGLELSITTNANNGNATIKDNDTPGNIFDDFILYNPATGFTGTDTFEYIVSDGTDTATATVEVTVNSVTTSPNEITGTSFRDNLTGTDGDDRITGGFGADNLTGGLGNDTFIYENLEDVGDTITDFTLGEDQIDFSSLLSNLGITSTQVGFTDTSVGTAITLDANNSGIFRNYLLVRGDGVNATTLDDANNFIF